jgi:hypothetical protein
MKRIIYFLSFICCAGHLNSQQASDYFLQPIVEYTYDAIPLDSLNDPISSQMFKRRDLFVDVAEYEGKLANILLTKSAPIDSIDIQPYLDSLFFHFDGMDGYEYLQSGSSLEDFLRSVDSLDLDPNFNFLDFFRSLKAWYSVYRFSSAINDEYHILNLDTLFIGLNIKFKYTGERFPDETINTQQGNFDCKKFLISWKVSLQIFQWLELLSTKDTVWIAPGNWIVQEIVPTNHIVLPSLFGIDPVS